jgi:WD40 repeat protein
MLLCSCTNSSVGYRRSSALKEVETTRTFYPTLRHPEMATDVGLSSGTSNKSSNNFQISKESFYTYLVHEGSIRTLVVNKEGTIAISGGSDGRVVLSSVKSFPKLIQEKKNRFVESKTLLLGAKPIQALALSPDGELLAVAQSSSVIVYSIPEHKIINRLTRLDGRVTALSWDPKGELLILGRATGDVYVWNILKKAADGDDLELYQGLSSPITKVLVHPSGRVFFIADSDGHVTLWRLLRAELEMGLLDENAIVDRDFKGNLKTAIAALGVRIEDLYINKEGSRLFAATTDGKIHSWKIRGLVAGKPLIVEKQAIFSVSGISTEELPKLLVVAGRSQRLRFWCQNYSPTEEGIPEPVAESDVFAHPLSHIRIGAEGGVLWAAQKTGNLLAFDPSQLSNMHSIKNRFSLCQDAAAN